ncbi:SHOCT domain-containing protein [Nocardioides sp. WL0053]|uniref:SHOCT domain-containing protein n=1 Tax=Nocardioides jiangsuensis TaxID=2866161 RepID=A0ABS7RJL4_9ACTN|nr:SHOCT domain-containing protein [Nocardioides jiangsuensis]MBY9074258.1 SHOCT domain-containing protein [Nocardioides jiangsuensis]
MSAPDELRRVSELHAAGHLTDDEFSAAKAQILRGTATPTRPQQASTDSLGDHTVPAPEQARDTGTDWVRGWLGRLSGNARMGLAAAAVLVVIAVTSFTIAGAGVSDDPTGTQARPAPPATDTGDIGEDSYEGGSAEGYDYGTDAEAEEEITPMYAGDLTITESGYTRMIDGAVASWGVIVDNPTPHFPNATVTVELLDADGAIEDSFTVDVTLEPYTQTPVGGYVPLNEYSTEDLAFSVDFDTYNEEDGEFFYSTSYSVTGDIIGRVLNAEIAVTAQSSEGVGDFCPIYLVFRDDKETIVGGAVIEDHPNVPAGTPKTFKKFLTDDLFIPQSAASFTGYPDHSACW